MFQTLLNHYVHVVWPVAVLVADQTGGNVSLPSWAIVLIGIVTAVSLATKQLVPGWIYGDLKERNNKLEEENKNLHDKLYEVASSSMPALESAAKVVDEAMVEIRILRKGQTNV